jgi:hypothetical protein
LNIAFVTLTVIHSSVALQPFVVYRPLFQFRKVTGWIPDEVIGYFNLPNISSRAMALELIQPLTEMSTRSKADNLTAICEPIV